MIVKDFLKKHLVDSGMFPEQANQVLEAYMKSTETTMKARWNDNTEDYPTAMKAIWILGINIEAIQWIDANIPKAWYRSMFLSASEREKLFAEAGINPKE